MMKKTPEELDTHAEETAAALKKIIQMLENGEIKACNLRLFKLDDTQKEVLSDETKTDQEGVSAMLERMLSGAQNH